MSPSRFACAVVLLALGGGLVGCSPTVQGGGKTIVEPSLSGSTLIAHDGARLPLRQWLPAQAPRAVLLAIHGFNDYSNYFAAPGAYLATTHGIASYAIDQRGFGQAPPETGVWAGTETYARDVKGALVGLKKHHPGLPIFVIGTSMGGAVVMVAMTDPDGPRVDGIILSAPAVWGRLTMPWYQRLVLWLGAHTVPNYRVSGRGLKIIPSDNREMLIELGRDPLVIKETRIGTIFGLVNLMDEALERAARLPANALILYGMHDQVIPKPPVVRMLERLPTAAGSNHRVALYEQGYHMLLRDLQRHTVWADIAAWIKDQTAPLPSGADQHEPLSLKGKN